MARFIIFGIIVSLVKSCRLTEMYSDYSKTHVFHFDQWFEDCRDVNGTTKMTNIKTSGNKTNMVAEMTYTVEQDSPDPFSVSVEIERCASKEAPDTCVKMPSIIGSRVCFMLRAKNQFFTPVVDCFKPSFDCPLKKGVYIGKGCYLQMSKFQMFPIPTNYYFRIRYLGLNSISRKVKQNFYCHIFSGKLERKRDVD